MPIVRNTFHPPWWLRSTHSQTMFPALFRKTPPLPVTRHRLTLPDSDFIDIDILNPHSSSIPSTNLTPPANTNSNSTPPIVLIIPGLEGSINSPYAHGILQAASNQGWRSALMHMRGCSGEINRLPRSYHSGETDDIRASLSYLQSQYPNAKIVVVGYSLGGNMLIKYLGEQGKQTPILAGSVVSVPFDLAKCATRINRGFSRVYQKRLVNSLRKTLLQKMNAMDVGLPLAPHEVNNLNTFWQFDDQVTAPLHGFSDAQDYYTQCSSLQFLSAVKIPLLMIHALDDPFLDPSATPSQHMLPPDALLELCDRGGHVGFVHGAFPHRPQYYLEQRIPQWLQQYLS